MRLHRPLPVEFRNRITQRFNPPTHYGVDYSCVVGTPLYAPVAGRCFANEQSRGFGRYVRIETADGNYVYLAHLHECVIGGGQWVDAGELVGHSGNTGASTGPHLHLEVRIGGREQSRAIDPEPLIDWAWDGTEASMKLSWHVQRILPWMPAAAQTVGLRWIKLVNPPEGGPDVFPSVAFKVARFWHDDAQASYIRDGYEGGRRWVRDFLPRMRACSWATCHETANEPGCNSNDDLRNLRLYSLGAMREADERGVKLCILNLAEGNPSATFTDTPERARASERWKLEQLAEAVVYAAENGHYVGLHCYWLPDQGIGPLNRWHSLGRVEWNVEQWLSMGVNPSKLRVLVNETGVDGLIRQTVAGWRSRSNLAEYASHVAQFDARARQLPWLHAYMLFTVGFEPPWGDYDHTEGDLRTIHAALPAFAPAPAPVPPAPAPPAPAPVPRLDPAVVRRRFTVEGFAQHVADLTIREPYSRVCIHHTARPTLARWQEFGGEHWIGNATRMGALERHYRSAPRNWTRFPHIFAAPDGIWVLGNLELDGAGVRGRNAGVRHIEIVGDHTTELPSGLTLENAVAAAAILLHRAGLRMEALTHHQALWAATDCPGAALIAEWPWFRSLVEARLLRVSDSPLEGTERAVWDAVQRHIVPLNPDAALEKAGAKRGLLPASREVRDVPGVVAQAFRGAKERKRQYIAYCLEGDWENVRWIEGAN